MLQFFKYFVPKGTPYLASAPKSHQKVSVSPDPLSVLLPRFLDTELRRPRHHKICMLTITTFDLANDLVT